MTAVICVFSVPGISFADDQTKSGLVQKRLALAESYLNSNTASRLSESGNDEARQFLDKAKQFLDQAKKDLKAGNLDQATENADQSLRAFSAAGAADTKSKKTKGQLTGDNKAIRAEIDAYLQAFKSALAEKGPAMAGLLDQQQVDGLLARADKLQASGDPKAADSALNEAKQLIVVALTKIRSNETVVYTREFQTPADEYRYEQERYQEYVTLSKKVLENQQPEESKMKMVEILQAKSEEHYQQAVMLAGQGDYEDAIKQMENGRKKLVQLLQLLGVPVSQ